MTRNRLRALMKRKASEPPRSRKRVSKFLKGNCAFTYAGKKDKAARLRLVC